MPLISVVIPVFNGEKTIAETIAAVLQQSWTDFELIIINDGSQDQTLAEIAQFPDDRIQIFSYSNAGLAASRNRGIAQATGEFITFLDADDLWTSDKLSAQVQALNATPEAVLAYSWTDYINESSAFLQSGTHITAQGDVYETLLVNNFVESGSNAMIRKEIFAEVGEFDTTLTAAEDWEMWLRIAARYPFVAVPQVQVLYRRSANAMSANLTRQEQECVTVLERAYQQAPPSLQHLKPVSYGNLYTYLAFSALEGTLTRPKAIAAARYFRLALQCDRRLFRRYKVLLISFSKILLAILLPPAFTQMVFAQIKQLKSNR